MTRYVALLRGVNVGGISMKMADVRKLFEDNGFIAVKTILASGNVVFDSDRSNRDALKADIEAALADRFGYEAWIVLHDTDTVRAIVESYPFDPEHVGWHPYVVFTSEADISSELLDLVGTLDPEVERVAAGDGVVYWEVERGQTLLSVFGKASGKKRYKSTTTTRNLRTLQKIIA